MSLNEWKPLHNPNVNFYLERLEDNTSELILLLESEKTKRHLRITFSAALCYHNIDEGDMLKALQEDELKGGFFIITDSSYLKWFHEQSLGANRDREITHYGIYTPNDVIDVLSLLPPKIEWVK